MPDQRMVDGSHSPTKWSRPAAATLPLLQCGHERVGVVQLGPGGVQEHHAVAHRRELLAPIIPTVSSVTGACSETTSASAEQLVEAVVGLVGVRVVRR